MFNIFGKNKKKRCPRRKTPLKKGLPRCKTIMTKKVSVNVRGNNKRIQSINYKGKKYRLKGSYSAKGLRLTTGCVRLKNRKRVYYSGKVQ